MRMLWLLMMLAICLSGLGCPMRQPKVQEVIAADTIRLDDGTTVRYAGITGPAPDSPWFGFCRDANGYLVDQKTVKLVWETDSAGAAAYVYTPVLIGQEPKYLFVNAELVKFGFAKTLPVPKNCRHRELWQNLWDLQENDAKPAQRGMWGKDKP